MCFMFWNCWKHTSIFFPTTFFLRNQNLAAPDCLRVCRSNEFGKNVLEKVLL